MSAAPLRILHVTTAADRVAGAERLLWDLARRADRARWRLRFVILGDDGPLVALLRDAGWQAEALGATSARAAAAGLARLSGVAREFRPDVLHAHLFHSAAAVALARPLLAARRLVQSRHYASFMPRYMGRVPYAVDRVAARCFDGLIAVSDAAREQLVGAEGVDPARVSVIENAVDCERLAALPREAGRRALAALGVDGDEDSVLIGCAASLVGTKGLPHLIDAFARLARARPKAHLILLGSGPDEPALREQARAAGIADVVHLLGHRKDALELCAGLDLYVQPSCEEGFGLALVEAMALGLPVIASAVGGMLRTVEDGKSGVHVPPADPARLAAAMTRVLSDPALARSLGSAARARATAHYSLGALLAAYDGFYLRVLAAPRAPWLV